MIVAGHRIDIARTPDDVFAYMTDPSKLPTWQDAVTVTTLTPGPVGVGTRFREVHQILGRRRTEVTEVVTFEPGRRFEIRMVEGVPIDGRWDLEPCSAGTRLTFTPTTRLPPTLRWLQPILDLANAAAFARFHRRLKRALEQPAR